MIDRVAPGKLSVFEQVVKIKCFQASCQNV